MKHKNEIFGIPYLVLAIAGLILLLALITLIMGLRRRELARFERE